MNQKVTFERFIPYLVVFFFLILMTVLGLYLIFGQKDNSATETPTPVVATQTGGQGSSQPSNNNGSASNGNNTENGLNSNSTGIGLIGDVTADQVAQLGWTNNNYQPETFQAEQIKEFYRYGDIYVFFGEKSAASREILPQWVTLAAQAGIASERIHYIAVDSKIIEPSDLIEKYNIKYLPTFIFNWVDGDYQYEIGRLEGYPEENFEKALRDIIGKANN